MPGVSRAPLHRRGPPSSCFAPVLPGCLATGDDGVQKDLRVSFHKRHGVNAVLDLHQRDFLPGVPFLVGVLNDRRTRKAGPTSCSSQNCTSRPNSSAVQGITCRDLSPSFPIGKDANRLLRLRSHRRWHGGRTPSVRKPLPRPLRPAHQATSAQTMQPAQRPDKYRPTSVTRKLAVVGRIASLKSYPVLCTMHPGPSPGWPLPLPTMK